MLWEQFPLPQLLQKKTKIDRTLLITHSVLFVIFIFIWFSMLNIGYLSPYNFLIGTISACFSPHTLSDPLHNQLQVGGETLCTFAFYSPGELWEQLHKGLTWKPLCYAVKTPPTVLKQHDLLLHLITSCFDVKWTFLVCFQPEIQTFQRVAWVFMFSTFYNVTTWKWNIMNIDKIDS